MTAIATLIPSNPYEGLEGEVDHTSFSDLAVENGKTSTWDVVESTHMGGTEIQYTSSVLKGEEAEKPKLNHCAITGDLNKIAHLVWERIKARTLTSAEAVAFLWASGKEFSSLIDKPWKSYDITILGAKEGGSVNVQSLLKSVPSNNKVLEVSTTEQELKKSIPFLVGICLAPYRIIQGMKVEYMDSLKQRMWAQIKGLVDPEIKKEEVTNFDFSGWLDDRSDWSQEKDYGVVVAGYDMFWCKCKEEKSASLRVCTIRARYLDCTAFMGWQYLRNITKLPFLELATWIWDDSMAAEFRQIFKKGEELDKEDSYLPYLSSMKISRKSPYSASVNPYLHMWIHSYGCLKSTTRSYNARMVGEINTDIPLRNAVFMYVAKGQGGDWKRQIVYKGDVGHKQTFVVPDGEVDTKKGKKREKIPPPPKPEARYWHRYIMAHGGDLPPHMWESVVKALSSIPNPRSQSIGEYLRRWGLNQQLIRTG